MRGRLTCHKHCKRWSVKNLPAWFLLVCVWSGLCWATVPLPSCLAWSLLDLSTNYKSHWPQKTLAFIRFFKRIPREKNIHELNSWVALGGFCFIDIGWFGEIFKVRLLGGCLCQGVIPALVTRIHHYWGAHHPSIWMLHGWLGKWKIVGYQKIYPPVNYRLTWL